jgi:GNAT superfamily N-acetyltransferase
LDYSISEKLESNELEFCTNWSNKIIDLNDSFRILDNNDLNGDYFFNRTILTNGIEESCIEEKEISSIVSRLKEISKKQTHDIYLHINDNFLSIKSMFEKNGLREIDKLTGLVRIVKNQNPFSLKEFNIQKIIPKGETYKVVRSEDEFDEWLNVYTSSFEIDVKKRATMRTILQKENFNNSEFILYESKSEDNTNRQSSKPMGCCLLFPTNNILGLYCLGTEKRYRKKGIASSIIDFAVTYAELNKFDFVGLQGLHSDHRLGFYQRRHFTKVYTNAIYSLHIS